MSSITTAIPTGPIDKWCLAPLSFYHGERYECANETENSKEDFQTFCCNGEIINAVWNIWEPGGVIGVPVMNLADMVCCGTERGAGGRPAAATHGVHGVLGRVADAAGADRGHEHGQRDAQLLLSVHRRRRDGGHYAPRPDITTLSPATTDEFGIPVVFTTTRPVSSTETGESGGITSADSSIAPHTTVLSGTVSQSSSGGGDGGGGSSTTAATSTPSSAASIGVRKGLAYVCLGLATMGLLWS
ncbi:hypothetical protein AAE478_009322 [Parahypoxylon ruwenzoriense]